MKSFNEENLKIGKRIREKRKERGLTQLTLSERAQMSLSGVGEIERGLRSPNSKTIEQIAKALVYPSKDVQKIKEMQIYITTGNYWTGFLSRKERSDMKKAMVMDINRILNMVDSTQLEAIYYHMLAFEKWVTSIKKKGGRG